MRSFKLEPFVWIHLAGLAAAPLWLTLVWLGLSVGTPWPGLVLELLLVASVSMVPVFWMQWSRPFNIFSILILAIKPEELSTEQRKILRLFQTTQHKVLTIIAAVLMLVILWFIYKFSPLASMAASSLPQKRIIGLSIASASFALANLFVFVPFSALGILLTNVQKFASIEPFSPEEIRKNFTSIGFKIKKILPTLTTDTTPPQEQPPEVVSETTTQ